MGHHCERHRLLADRVQHREPLQPVRQIGLACPGCPYRAALATYSALHARSWGARHLANRSPSCLLFLTLRRYPGLAHRWHAAWLTTDSDTRCAGMSIGCCFAFG